MASLQDWGVPLAVIGMLLSTLLAAALYTRYLAYLADVRIAVRRLDLGIRETTSALAALTQVPLSRELRLTLRSDILARYQKIRTLYRRYPGVIEGIRSAEQALDAEGPPATNGVGPLASERAFRATLAALDRLHAILARGGTLRPVPADVRRIFLREIAERRAEVTSRFHLVEARRHDANGNPTRARTHLLALLQALRQHGPATQFIRELASEANSALLKLSDQRPTAASLSVDATAA